MTKLSLFNFWSKRVSKGVAHSAQAVLRPGALIANSKNVQSGSCGQGSCNCGGSCNGECGGESE
ncbi:MAG: hypothetical protein WC415_06135 [Patescibacteria group bacterium]|jgi:hypothetical protein